MYDIGANLLLIACFAAGEVSIYLVWIALDEIKARRG